eukprot:m.241866 g.241866  ORF g.241866 m.241866 type:complete len:442 (+) comp19428_c0_seq1:319-1644(+)
MSRNILCNVVTVVGGVFILYLILMQRVADVSSAKAFLSTSIRNDLDNQASTLVHKHDKPSRDYGTQPRCEQGSCRLIIVNTMTYEHIFKRPNLARTAAQLLQAGPKILWIVTEDTHSLRKMTRGNDTHYTWIVDDTRKFLLGLGVDVIYISHDSPFPLNSPRSPKIETHQRNQGLNYSYQVVEDADLRLKYDVNNCTLYGARGASIRNSWRAGQSRYDSNTKAELLKCPIVYIADDDNVYMPTLWPVLRKVQLALLFPTGNMGYDGIEGPIVKTPATAVRDETHTRQKDSTASVDASSASDTLPGRVVGFNAWHGSKLNAPRGWDKNGAPRRFKVDMAGIAFSAVLAPRFTGPRYGFHETDIVEQTGVVHLEQIEGTAEVLAHHVHNEKTSGRLCYPIDWDYTSTQNVWMNIREGRTYATRLEACGKCAPAAGATEFHGCL